MAIKLIALDIDGTLYNDARKILPSSLKAIAQAKARGVKIVITTGRPWRSTKPVLKELHLDHQKDQYVIILHGAIVATTAGKKIFDHPLPYATVAKVIHYGQKHPAIDLMTQNADGIFVTKRDLNGYTALESYKNMLPLHFRTEAEIKEQGQKTPFYKMMFSGYKEQIDALQKELPAWLTSDLKALRSEICYIDMVNKKVDKGWAISNLAQRLDIKQDEVMAAGDGNSDIPMVKYAGCGVAMGNGTPALKKVADYVTGTNNQDGLAQAIDKFVK